MYRRSARTLVELRLFCELSANKYLGSVATDLLMALVKDIARFRPELKVLILSATINASHFANYFDGAGIFNIPGRTFKVHARFLESPEANYLAAAITTVFQIHLAAPEREDILVFLTGEDEIETARENIESTMKKLKGMCLC